MVLLSEVSVPSEGKEKEDQKEAILKELVEIWRKGGGWFPRREQPSSEKRQDEQIHTVLRNIVGGLKSLGLLPKKASGLPSLNKPLDRNRLSGFLYNISMYLQEMSAELDDDISFSDDHFWENVLHSFLQYEGKMPLGDWAGRIPPRPSFRLQDLFLSLRGSPHWDGLLGLVQSILTLIEQQPQRPLLTFISQNWKTISALLDTALQALVSGTYNQAIAGLQGFICVLKGQSGCAFNLSWLQQLLTFLETRNWKPVVNLHPASAANDHRDGTFLAERFKPFSIPPEVLPEEKNKSQDMESVSYMQALLLQALSKSNSGERAVQYAERNPALVQGLDGLRRGLLHRVGSTVYGNLRRKVSRVTMALLDDLGSMAASETEEQSSEQQQSSKRTRLIQPLPMVHDQIESELSTSAEILEAACNASIPGLSGVSNFTVFLYCNLFDGEEDFLWVHVCSEFFAQDFNNTVCANSSFWLQRAHQAAVSKDYYYLNQSSIDDLCVQLSSDVAGSSTSLANGDCLELLSARSFSAQDFRRCFLPNNSALILGLCGNVSYPIVHTGWAAEYCSKILSKDSDHNPQNVLCNFLDWSAEHLANTDLLEHCGDTAGLRDYICKNISLYAMLVPKHPILLDYCNSKPELTQETQCVLQQLFNMLPAPYDFDTHQLCRNPIPILQEAIYKLNHCEGAVDERVGWLATVSYVLQVLDFVVGLSTGLEEREREVRQGLGQAILLSRLLDNSSFWATLRPNASISVLQTVGVFLRQEQNLSLKEDLLSCFSPVLWDLIQKEDNSSALRFLIQEYLQMPRERIRTLVLSAEKDAVKRFLSHVHQSWDQLQVETTQASPKEKAAMETMTAAFIHKFPRVTPELFVDLSQFIPYMSVSDIMNFPASLIANDTVSSSIPTYSAVPLYEAAVVWVLEHLSTNNTLYLHCLLPFISLKKLATKLDEHTVLHRISLYRNMSWSPQQPKGVSHSILVAIQLLKFFIQQAQLLFRMIQQTENVTRETVLHLGHIANGMSCKSLQLWANESEFSELLRFITELPGGLRPALRKCVVEKLRKRPDVDLDGFNPSFTARLPVTMIEHLSNASLLAVLTHVRRHFIDFLELPRHKQMTLAEKAIDVFMIAEDRISGASMDLLGPLLFFLDRDTLSQVDRDALKLRLEDLKQYCMPADIFREMASLLTERNMLGEPKSWAVGDVEHVDRLVFTLSPQMIRSLPLDDLGKDTVEQVLQSQWHWKDTELGKRCVDSKGLKDKIYSLIHKIIRGRRWIQREPIPTCTDIKGTFPSAWRWYQLNRMKRRELKECVEFLGQDGSLDPEQRWALWTELRSVYKPVRALRPAQILELGCIITEMSERELQAVNMSDLAVVAHLGSFEAWNPRKMRAALQGFLRHRKKKPEALGVVELVSLGNLLCGFTPAEISRLDAFNLSMAAMFLRESSLPCSEQQADALTTRLASPLAFGPVSSWSAEIFTEIGTLAAGLDDMVLSSLVREQIEGLTPLALSLIPPKKLAVVFSARQLSWLNSEQASAVTEEQWEKLDNEQKQALSMALYEGDAMLGHRGTKYGYLRDSRIKLHLM
ncbi:stereocilin-like, partial [Clarias magur]